MIIKELGHLMRDTLLETLNEAFSDYDVPLNMTAPQLDAHLTGNNVLFPVSPGAFEDDKLIGFILHGCGILHGVKTLYNAGTGVIPSKRGHRLTSQMYDYVIPEAKKRDIKQILLEVLSTNERAFKTYKAVGFTEGRDLVCYQGTIAGAVNNEITIKELKTYNWAEMQKFWDYKPAWQNNIPYVDRSKHISLCLAAYKNDEFIGYLIYNTSSNTVLQFAVSKEHRRHRIASALFANLTLRGYKTAKMLNVDTAAEDAHKFIAKLGLKESVRQKEMTMNL